ncbi:microsomal glutathione S-transferase 1-like [Teleopsis dalmanni]|uniref:microsomal glutathione S-transferase 1-like n=1 Tax=Teleopsis dalmanni TaxID=139649 RepID=UPI000D32AA62|nr:microsomal glutathione S-transferase 1-like [Teleopsis dalmanni]
MSNAVYELLTLDNVVFKEYLFWSAVLILKMLIMSPMTGFHRFRTQTFANPEDLLSKKLKVKFDDPHVERVRRAHRNDLENILPFFAIGFFYVLINPSVFLACNLFRLFAIARIVHTFVYAVVVIPQPARFLAFGAGLLPSLYMGLQVLLATF